MQIQPLQLYGSFSIPLQSLFFLLHCTADCCKDSMYIIDPGLSTEDVMELIKNIENNTLDISRIVLYPYSVVFNVLHELKKNLTNLRNNKNVTVIERY